MKKFNVVLTMCIIVVMALCLVACHPTNPVQQEDTAVYITADGKLMAEMNGTTVKDYLDVLVKKGYLTYELNGTFLTTMNGLTPDSTKSEYWFIYSNDDENTNGEWGTYEHDGVTYKSTTLGICDLPVKEGVTYLFMVSTYSM